MPKRQKQKKNTRRGKRRLPVSLSTTNKFKLVLLIVAVLTLFGGVIKYCWPPKQATTQRIQVEGEGTVTTVRGDGTIIANVDTMTIEKREGLDPTFLLDKILELAVDKARLEDEVRELEQRAIAQAQQLEAEGNSQAKEALNEYQKNGNTEKLLALLLQERERIGQQVTSQTVKLTELDRQITSVAFRRRDMSIAAQAVERLLATSPDDPFGLHIRSSLCLIRGDLEQAEADIQHALKLAADANDSQAEAKALDNLGLIYCVRENWSEAEKVNLRALSIYSERGDMQGLATVYSNLVALYAGKGDWGAAENSVFKAIGIYEKLGDSEGMASARANLGVLLARKGDWEKAKEMFQSALESHRQSGYTEGIVNQYFNMGATYLHTGDLIKSEQTFLEALKVATDLGYQTAIANIHSLLGVVYLKRRDMNQSENTILKAIGLFQRLGDKSGIALNYSNLGIVYQNCGYLEKAEQMHNKSLELHKSLGDNRGIAKNYANLGLVSWNNGYVDAARSYWNLSLELFKEFSMTRDLEQVQVWLKQLDAESKSDDQ